jgi:hypothetical protein
LHRNILWWRGTRTVSAGFVCRARLIVRCRGVGVQSAASGSGRALHGPTPSVNKKSHRQEEGEHVMRIKAILLCLTMSLGSTAAFADLEPWKDYSISDTVWSVTTIKVHSNMDDAYLEGLKSTWVASSEVAKKLGQIEDYHIYRSDLPESGSFNLLLVVQFKNNEMLTPNKARYQAFMKEWGEERNKKTIDTAQHAYPAMRDITGEYNVREITFTK